MDVVVLGAGYAGTIVANTVARRLASARVVVVNPRPLFVERVRLHQQLAGSATAATSLDVMLRDGIRTILARSTVHAWLRGPR